MCYVKCRFSKVIKLAYVTQSNETSHKKCWKIIFRFVDVENAEILSSKMIFHLSYLLKVLPMKSQYFSWKFLCFLLICNMFIGLYLEKCSGNLRQVLWEWVTYFSPHMCAFWGLHQASVDIKGDLMVIQQTQCYSAQILFIFVLSLLWNSFI